MKEGAFDYITKPVNFDDFSEVIKRLGMFISVIAITPPKICLQS